jgi:hypothetical protein
MPLLAAAAVVLVIAWLIAFLVLHITGALIHLLILVAVVMLVLHFLRKRQS